MAMTPLTAEMVERMRMEYLRLYGQSVANVYPQPCADIHALCDAALLGLKGAEPREPVAEVIVSQDTVWAGHGRRVSWLSNPIDIPVGAKLYLAATHRAGQSFADGVEAAAHEAILHTGPPPLDFKLLPGFKPGDERLLAYVWGRALTDMSQDIYRRIKALAQEEGKP